MVTSVVCKLFEELCAAHLAKSLEIWSDSKCVYDSAILWVPWGILSGVPVQKFKLLDNFKLKIDTKKQYNYNIQDEIDRKELNYINTFLDEAIFCHKIITYTNSFGKPNYLALHDVILTGTRLQ